MVEQRNFEATTGLIGKCSIPHGGIFVYSALQIPVHPSHSLCDSPRERALVLEKVMRHRISDVFLSGCSINSLPESFKKNCSSLGCTLRGLNFERRPSQNYALELQLSIAYLHDPWPKSMQTQRIVSVLENSGLSELILDTRNEILKPAYQPEQVVLRIDRELAVKIEPELEAIGIHAIVM